MLVPTSLSGRLHPFLKVLTDNGTPYLNYAQKYGLPFDIFERKDRRYSLPLVYGMLDEVAEREGIDDLAFRGVLEEHFKDIEEPYKTRLATACTALVSLHRYVQLAKAYNGRDSGIRVGLDTSWFWVAAHPRVAQHTWNRYSDWSNVLIPILVLREALGQTWTPASIWIQTRCEISDLIRETFPNSLIKTGQPFSGFSVPTHMLSWRMPGSLNLSRLKYQTDVPKHIRPLSEARTIEELVAPYACDAKFDIQIAAELTGLSKRTLQRHLAAAGTSFRDLITKEKFAVASENLAYSDKKIIEVALEVGFDDPSHFARAFKRLSGMTPRQYRRKITRPD